jgi:transcriptional regulator with XRE-family HTH domain
LAYKSSVAGFKDRLFQAQLAYEGRAGKRLTRMEFAEMVGVSQPTASDWFTGTRTPSLEQTETIARCLGVSPGWLGFGEGAMNHEHEPPKPTQHESRVQVGQSKRRVK